MTDKDDTVTDIGLESYQDETDENIKIWEIYDLEVDDLKNLAEILDGAFLDLPIRLNELNDKIRKTLLDLNVEL